MNPQVASPQFALPSDTWTVGIWESRFQATPELRTNTIERHVTLDINTGHTSFKRVPSFPFRFQLSAFSFLLLFLRKQTWKTRIHGNKNLSCEKKNNLRNSTAPYSSFFHKLPSPVTLDFLRSSQEHIVVEVRGLDEIGRIHSLRFSVMKAKCYADHGHLIHSPPVVSW
ncbi:hypothetical protein CKAN_00915200 [Cinnamomum micranthum f. kanehirae]|uniref:Uncharacterized protein n=1 Tax=Cinnamomum micranthum f. kanehirae TaxID=337451 RepID=A0A3S3Q6Z2_9MAGN|nr:hypothetical protein CKAN_00915200 [Cinnamomum micranthum f. kanehirae]